MNREQLEEIRARTEAATPGPWEARGAYPWLAMQDEEKLFTVSTNMAARPAADAEFIAHARTDVPALLDEIDRLNQKIKSFEEFGSAEALRAGGREHAEYAVRVDRAHPRRREKAGDVMTQLCAETALYASKVWDGWTTLERVVRRWPDGSSYVGAWKPTTDPLAEYHRRLARRKSATATTAEGSAEGGTSKGSEVTP